MNLTQKNHKTVDVLAYGGLLHRITSRIRQSLELKEILSATVAEVRSLLQTDRVKVYRFQPDHSGQVIAESNEGKRLPSLIGLNFSAGDIPPQAREMYVKARQRTIVDVAAQKILLSRLDAPLTTGDLTIEVGGRQQPIGDIIQRAVEPCHVEYLRAMGVLSSLVVPILHKEHLWGLLISHHSQAQAFAEEDLQLVQLVAEQLSIAIAQSELLSQTREQVRRETIINQITPILHSPRTIEDILQIVTERIVRAASGCGGRLYLTSKDNLPPTLYTCGTQPKLSYQNELSWLEHTPFWQQLMEEESQNYQSVNVSNLRVVKDIYQDPELELLTLAFRPTRIRGMLALPIRYSKELLGCITLFRKAINTQILWAGYLDQDERQDRPRQSFEMWRELKNNQPPEWTREDIDLIQSLGIHLAMAIMQHRFYELEIHNRELEIARAVAEDSSRMKSQFLAATSHELRTPLATTLNCLQILKRGFYKSEDELKKYIDLADKSAKNLVSLINDVLDITKIEAGSMTVELESVSLPSLLEEQRELFSIEIERKGIELIIDCQVDCVYADEDKLKQVLTNLLSNAFKFTDKGQIRIQVIKQEKVQGISLLQPMVEIAVIDTGIGIEMKKPELLLEPFVQEDGSIKRRFGGTGLGLAICKRLIEMMGGKIQLASMGKGHGTTVTITLPYADNPAKREKLE